MTIKQAFDWFDDLVDKADSPYFTNAEKERLMTNAQQALVDKFVFDLLKPTINSGERPASVGSSLESQSAGLEVLEPLILDDLLVTSSASGVITRAQIKAAITTEISQSVDYIVILALGKDIGEDSPYPVRFVRQNDFNKFQNNSFKSSSSNDPQYKISRDKLKVYPAGAEDYYITLIKYPLDVVYDAETPANNVDFELPSFLHDEIIRVALVESGVATRDEALVLMEQNARKDQSLLR